jgi:hypothetical protein
MFEAATVSNRDKVACPDHGHEKEFDMVPLPGETEWRRCNHIGSKGGRCMFTRRFAR